MRKRNVHVQFWLDKKEAEAFNKKVKRSGLSREAYLRHLVNGLVPQDAPPPAYYDFMRELHRIGGNLTGKAAALYFFVEGFRLFFVQPKLYVYVAFSHSSESSFLPMRLI